MTKIFESKIKKEIKKIERRKRRNFKREGLQDKKRTLGRLSSCHSPTFIFYKIRSLADPLPLIFQNWTLYP